MEMKKGFDVIVICGGPGGYVAAIRCTQLGANVLLIEKDEPGGTCLNRRCIPTKTILSSVKLFDYFKEVGIIKGNNIHLDMNKLLERKNREIKILNTAIQFLIKDNGVSFIKGKATFIDHKTIEVDSIDGKQKFEGSKIIIATGSEPA